MGIDPCGKANELRGWLIRGAVSAGLWLPAPDSRNRAHRTRCVSEKLWIRLSADVWRLPADLTTMKKESQGEVQYRGRNGPKSV